MFRLIEEVERVAMTMMNSDVWGRLCMMLGSISGSVSSFSSFASVFIVFGGTTLHLLDFVPNDRHDTESNQVEEL